MSNFKGTKEKWEIGEYLIYADDFFQTHIAIIPDSYNEDIKKANAQLITHAPEMLEMLEEMQTLCDLIRFPTEDELGKMNLKLKELINKATEI